ncbi:hypothetical protein BASA50_001198 [Batrachochytrium salamandrivorans]|uniref:Uncharacterized protein n=1 Tax=Batrachochytrium salamandrivorans TaxID=1357716 RepID=A0ABQ8EUT7_9FUNG|nr:hypothetical protein BASA62_005363 [Batrachochytrium salamandrivorans]KAH6582177.1 hypothetical protein BASA60_002084 [Batrachochytrium salamandrivorans]KAH6584274.1 hypothetical protein BASA61_007552 [Batrachochytrium salamandrivorans]KAH6585589.1 hypothetical protein BASA50_001198 [Batrachochytrium salamandrivorans]KAH9271338.1 hypothetical protein BASA83_006428 [Batrachochytrium salamandrivorans]
MATNTDTTTSFAHTSTLAGIPSTSIISSKTITAAASSTSSSPLSRATGPGTPIGQPNNIGQASSIGLNFSWVTIVMLLLAVGICVALYYILRRLNRRHQEQLTVRNEQQSVRMRRRLLGSLFDPNPRSLPEPPPTYTDLEAPPSSVNHSMECPPDYEATQQSRLHVEVLDSFQHPTSISSQPAIQAVDTSELTADTHQEMETVHSTTGEATGTLTRLAHS